MKRINDSDRINLKRLCSYRQDDSMLGWFLEGNPYCAAWVDNKMNPKAAVITVADFCYLLGDVKHPAEIVQILLDNARYKVIIACGPQWVDFLKEYMKDKVYCYKRFAIKHEPDVFDKNNLRHLIGRIDPGYNIKKIDKDIYHEVLGIDWAADGCCYFKSREDFLANGLGYTVYKGGELVCIASSYTTYKNNLGVTIGTLEGHRRKGLAAACAATLILDCLDKGIYPEWEAANMDSVALAEKLGYHFDKAFDVYSLIIY